jgi:hypothetical protein
VTWGVAFAIFSVVVLCWIVFFLRQLSEICGDIEDCLTRHCAREEKLLDDLLKK